MQNDINFVLSTFMLEEVRCCSTVQHILVGRQPCVHANASLQACLAAQGRTPAAGASLQVGATGDQGVTGELPLGCCMPCGLCALAEQALSATPLLCP